MLPRRRIYLEVVHVGGSGEGDNAIENKVVTKKVAPAILTPLHIYLLIGWCPLQK